MNTPTRSLSLFIYTVILFGVIVIILASRSFPADWIGMTLFACMAALAELASVELFVNSRTRISAAGIMVIAAIVALGPMSGVWIQLVTGLMTSLTSLGRKEPSPKNRASWIKRSAFNTGMFILSAAAAGEVYFLAGGRPENSIFYNSIPLLLAGAASILTNMALLLGVITLQTGEPVSKIFNRDFRWSLPINFIGEVLGGGLVALAYQQFAMLGLAIFILPIVSLTLSFRLYVSNVKQYVDKLEDSNLGLLETLGAVIDAYDVYTYGHSRQVAIYAQAISERMGLHENEISDIVRAAIVHDIGKVGIADSIIGKPSSLSDEEYRVIKRHPVIGAEILSQMPGFQNVVPYVKYHHERCDGSGYPDGLKGAEIPLGARILAVADTLDALNSDRPYRPVASFDEVKGELIDNAGVKFDAEVIRAFQQLAEENDKSFFPNSALSVNRVGLHPRDSAKQLYGRFFMKKGMVLAK